jgi:hypothetical protein
MEAISITAANVLKSSTGSVANGIAGASITAGQAVYIDTGDSNKIKLADANGTAPANTFAGIALNAATAGQPVSYCTNDTAGFTIGATVLAGDTIWLSPTAGGLTKTFADLTTLDKVIVVGVMLTTTTMNLTPVTGGVLA